MYQFRSFNFGKILIKLIKSVMKMTHRMNTKNCPIEMPLFNKNVLTIEQRLRKEEKIFWSQILFIIFKSAFM